MVKLINTSGYNQTPYTAPKREQYTDLPQQWAIKLLQRPSDSWVILDTETTGLSGTDEIIELSVIDGAGSPLIENKRFKPKCEISGGALAVHGITKESLEAEGDFADFAEELAGVLKDKRIVIYNAQFDLRMLTQTALIHSAMSKLVYPDVNCAMSQYSAFVGEIKRGGGYRWQALPGGDHSSIGDCRAVLNLIQRMAGQG